MQSSLLRNTLEIRWTRAEFGGDAGRLGCDSLEAEHPGYQSLKLHFNYVEQGRGRAPWVYSIGVVCHLTIFDLVMATYYVLVV